MPAAFFLALDKIMLENLRTNPMRTSSYIFNILIILHFLCKIKQKGDLCSIFGSVHNIGI